MKVCLVTAFPPSRGDLNEYGYHLARTIQSDGRAELHILADRVGAAETVPGLSIERVWRFDSLWNPIYLLRAVRRIRPDVVWFNMGFATFAGRPVPAFFATAIPLLLRAFPLVQRSLLLSSGAREKRREAKLLLRAQVSLETSIEMRL